MDELTPQECKDFHILPPPPRPWGWRLKQTTFVVLLVAIAINLAAGWQATRARQMLTGKLAEVQKLLAEVKDLPTAKMLELSKYALVHMPPDGKCPLGFEVAPRIFSKDGRSYAGCLRPQLGMGGMVDKLEPDESLHMFQFSLPDEKEDKPPAPTVRQ